MFFEPIKEPIVGARPPTFDRHVLVSLVETLGFLANSATKHTLAPGELCATREFGATGLLITASRLKA